MKRETFRRLLMAMLAGIAGMAIILFTETSLLNTLVMVLVMLVMATIGWYVAVYMTKKPETDLLHMFADVPDPNKKYPEIERFKQYSLDEKLVIFDLYQYLAKNGYTLHKDGKLADFQEAVYDFMEIDSAKYKAELKKQIEDFLLDGK